jgi:hypothetical protein
MQTLWQNSNTHLHCIGGYLSMFIAFIHLVLLFWSTEFQSFVELSIVNISESQFSSAILAFGMNITLVLVLFIFGLYGLSAGQKIRSLPFLKKIIFFIAGFYLLRGFTYLLFDLVNINNKVPFILIYSGISILTGVIYLLGGLWKVESAPQATHS